jgi:hypothetical protein
MKKIPLGEHGLRSVHFNSRHAKRPINSYSKFISISIPNWLLRIDKGLPFYRVKVLFGISVQYVGRNGKRWSNNRTLVIRLVYAVSRTTRRKKKLNKLGVTELIRVASLRLYRINFDFCQQKCDRFAYSKVTCSKCKALKRARASCKRFGFMSKVEAS